jgi:hypothetical protein
VGRVVRWLAAGALAAAGVMIAPAPAWADAVDPAGSCTGRGEWTTAGFSEESTDLDPEDVIEIPRADEVRWTGRVVGPTAGTPRPIDGRIALALPPLLGSIPLGTWSGQGVDVEKTGTYSYDLPSWVPSDVEFDLRARHDEGGKRHCTGAVGLIIEGGPFDSPLIWVALAGLLVTAIGMALVGRRPAGGAGLGRLLVGASVGLLFGLFGGLTLILFGVIPLASPIVTVLLGAGLLLGAVWGRWAPLGSHTGPAPPAATPA